MKHKRGFTARYIALAVFFILVCIIYTGRLINIQIAGQDYYAMSTDNTYSYRTETIQAQRGEIYDRNGVPLVVNQYTYSVNLDGGSMPAAQREKNEVILSLLSHAEALGEGNAFTLPASPFTVIKTTSDGVPHFEYNSAYFETSAGRKFYKLVTLLSCTEESPAKDTSAALLARYGLIETNKKSKETTYLYDADTVFLLLTVRLDMELSNFSAATPYTILEGVSLKLLSRIAEAGLRGVTPYTASERAYTYPGYASHILGWVGKITSDKVDYYTELGYPLDAVVGISGAEQAFESYLHGVDGERTIVEDAYGNIVDEYISKEPQAGANVYLTIDIKMQMTAEDALADNISYIVEKAVAGGKQFSGEDAETGALSAIDVKTGEVLALASHPTFNLATFRTEPEAFSDPRAPFFNRALNGTFPPGSTFKIGVAAAALAEGIITPQTKIQDKGIYEFYSTFTPACWIYNQSRSTHGSINVTTAIQVSCNYFFYEVGRLLTIETMNRYSRAFGLGVPTGIELGEGIGVLAGPDYRDENGLGAWNPGDTLAAAIGQSDNLFSPLQISVYMSSIINGGTRMKAYILYKVESFSGEVLYSAEPTIADDSITLSNEVHDVLLNAMRRVTENGSAARVFSSYPIEVGGKTGTAQVNQNESDNAIFTAFAPFDDPRIAVTCIIEQGANGTDAGYAVRDVFDHYFEVGK